MLSWIKDMTTRRMLVLSGAALALIVLALLLAAACGDGDAGPDSDGEPPVMLDGDDDGESGGENGDNGFSGAINPCELLTVEEVSAALGEEASAVEPRDFDPVVSCTYETETLNSVSVSVYADSREMVEAYFESGNEASEVIEGVGERAYWYEPFGDLDVLSGEYYLAVSVSSSDGEIDELETAKTLAQAAIGRLP